MVLEAQWADYARIQTAAKLTSSISQSNANDVRLDRVIEGIALGGASEAIAIERAVNSYSRRERSRQSIRRSTEHAFMPLGAVGPDETLVWKAAWTQFRKAFSTRDLCLLVKSETISDTSPTTAAERTKLSRIKSSATYRTVQAAIFL